MTEQTKTPASDAPAPNPKRPGRRLWIYIGLFVAAAVATVVVVGLLMNIQGKKDEAKQYPLKVVEVGPQELDPAVWGQNFPVQYDSFMKTARITVATTYGGSEPYCKLERYPAMKRLWAGYAFSVDHNEERGHQYALTDQLETERIVVKEQPGACANCHAAESAATDRARWAGRRSTIRPTTSSRTSSTRALPAPTATTLTPWPCGSPARPSSTP